MFAFNFTSVIKPSLRLSDWRQQRTQKKKMQLQFRSHDKKVNDGFSSFLGYQADDTLSYT